MKITNENTPVAPFWDTPDKIRYRDPLDYIDGCMDGAECPDAEVCRDEKPEGCPLLDDQFEIDPDVPLDKAMFNDN